MNCNVSADFPTPPLPTMITLWMTAGACVFGFDIASQDALLLPCRPPRSLRLKLRQLNMTEIVSDWL